MESQTYTSTQTQAGVQDTKHTDTPAADKKEFRREEEVLKTKTGELMIRRTEELSSQDKDIDQLKMMMTAMTMTARVDDQSETERRWWWWWW